jgi:hypothetical protein
VIYLIDFRFPAHPKRDLVKIRVANRNDIVSHLPVVKLADPLLRETSSIHAKLLRIDVDNPPKGKAYGIPKDTPFVKTKGARPEVYAYALRQLWRFSIYCSDRTRTG